MEIEERLKRRAVVGDDETKTEQRESLDGGGGESVMKKAWLPRRVAWVLAPGLCGARLAGPDSAGTAVASYCYCITRFTSISISFKLLLSYCLTIYILKCQNMSNNITGFPLKIPRIYPATAANMRITIHNIACVRLPKS